MGSVAVKGTSIAMGVRVRKHRGCWWVFVNYQGHRKAKRVGSRHAAETVAAKIQVRLNEGDCEILAGSDRPETFRDYAERWLAETVAPHRKERTVEGYRIILERHVWPTLGAFPVAAVTRESLRGLIAKLTSARLKRGTLQNVLGVIRACLNQALDDGRIGSNPAVRLAKHLAVRKDLRGQLAIYTPAEVARVFRAAEQCAPDISDLVRVLFLTGLRLGEALGLQWGDLDHAGGFLEIRRTVEARPKRFLVTSPKSGKLRRVDVPRSLLERLARRRYILEAEAVVAGRALSRWVFPQATNPEKPLNDAWIRAKRWHPLLKHAGLRRIRLHDARHTYASLLLQRGEPIAYVKDQMGHSSIQITVDLYGHLIPGANRHAADRLAAAIEVEADSARQTRGPHPGATPAQPALDDALTLLGENDAEGLDLQGVENGAPGEVRTGSHRLHRRRRRSLKPGRRRRPITAALDAT
jgi:integrase